MYAPDLATECQIARGDAVRAIGWLQADQPFATGNVDQRLLTTLRTHITDPGRWLPFASAGLHTCDLGGCERAAGSQFVIVPSTSCVYVAPDLVVHYVEQHHYAPPAEFVDAMLACPEQSSAAYVDLLVPFANVWQLSPDAVRRIAADAPKRRKVHLDEREANKGRFKW